MFIGKISPPCFENAGTKDEDCVSNNQICSIVSSAAKKMNHEKRRRAS